MLACTAKNWQFSLAKQGLVQKLVRQLGHTEFLAGPIIQLKAKPSKVYTPKNVTIFPV
jgi:hypothetical protein